MNTFIDAIHLNKCHGDLQQERGMVNNSTDYSQRENPAHHGQLLSDDDTGTIPSEIGMPFTDRFVNMKQTSEDTTEK